MSVFCPGDEGLGWCCLPRCLFTSLVLLAAESLRGRLVEAASARYNFGGCSGQQTGLSQQPGFGDGPPCEGKSHRQAKMDESAPSRMSTSINTDRDRRSWLVLASKNSFKPPSKQMTQKKVYITRPRVAHRTNGPPASTYTSPPAPSSNSPDAFYILLFPSPEAA